MTKNGALSARQQRLITALLTAGSIRAAAKAADVPEVTVYRWLRCNPAVRAALSFHQDQTLGQVSRACAALMSNALAVLGRIANDPDAPHSAQVAAARAILENGLRLQDGVVLAARVSELESRLDQEGL